MFTESDFHLVPTVYEWTGRALALLEKVLRVRIRLHHRRGQLEEGEIFLFNHFARFETFIPQYLIHRETGALSRSVAGAEFFREDDAFSRFLLSLGAVPNDFEGLLPFLAAEVLRGRKVIVFPEGGMVKDRRVLDARGRYGVYSRSARERRKHHTGAAVVALAVEGFRAAVRQARADGRTERLRAWTRELGLPSTDALLDAARRPTVVVPCSITFYPIRITQNPLRRAAELFRKGLSPRAAEELLIEGNLLLRDTDMDVRLGDPVRPDALWGSWDRWLARRVGRRASTLAGFFAPEGIDGRWDARALGRRRRRQALLLRDQYMAAMYGQTTVNLSHLAASLVYRLLDRGTEVVEAALFRRMLYLAVKAIQGEPSLHLHRSLRDPDTYGPLLNGGGPAWEQFLESATSAGLVEAWEGRYRFLPKLREEHGFDEIRLENPLAVYANEAAPLAAVARCLGRGAEDAPSSGREALALHRFDDLLRAYHWDWEAFRERRHEAVNRDERATESGEPFLLLPDAGRRRLGVLLVHGFTASPAEVRPLAQRLAERGYPCLGVRLRGHGTSPWDLLERGRADWLASVREGYGILGAFADRLCLVGFSAGGTLALRLAAEAPEGLAGVVAVSTPVKWRDPAMGLVPMLHGVNVLARAVSSGAGLKPFHHVVPEHAHINYLHKPVRALYELTRLIAELEGLLGRVRCPVLLLQGTDDPTVDPESGELLRRGLASAPVTLVAVPSGRHGILYEDVGVTQGRVAEFLDDLEGRG